MNLKSMKEKIKDWLYRKFISKGLLEVRKEAYDKGYDHGKHELDDTMQYVLNQKYTAEHWLVNPDEVLTTDEKGRVYISGKPITDIEVKELMAEAKGMRSFRLYRIIQETLRQKAVEKSVLQSKNFEEVLSGKLMIHNLGIIKSIVDVIADYKF